MTSARLAPSSRCVLGAVLVAALVVSCRREERSFRPLPHDQPAGDVDVNAFVIATGERLFESFNCVGCHGHGGGGMGPPLMDGGPIHGTEPESIFTVIVDGMPNGMPAFRGKITDEQVWALVAYVRSLSGLARGDATASRSDHMRTATGAPPRPASRAERLLQQQRAREDAVLHTYAWIDRSAGLVRIPIDRAIEFVAEGRPGS